MGTAKKKLSTSPIRIDLPVVRKEEDRKPEDVKLESRKPENVKTDSFIQEETIEESSKQTERSSLETSSIVDAGIVDNGLKESLNLEADKQDATELESNNLESLKKESINLETTFLDAIKLDSSNLDSSFEEAINLEDKKQESRLTAHLDEETTPSQKQATETVPSFIKTNEYKKVSMKLSADAFDKLQQFRVATKVPYEILVDILIRNFDGLPERTKNLYLKQAKEIRTQRLIEGQEKTMQTIRARLD
jgi:hypothetical protein